jgi:hypothetical protein
LGDILSSNSAPLYGVTGQITSSLILVYAIQRPIRTVVGKNGVVVNAGVDNWFYVSDGEMVMRNRFGGMRVNEYGLQQLVQIYPNRGFVWVNREGETRVFVATSSHPYTYAVGINDKNIINDGNGTLTLTISDDTCYEGREIWMRNTKADGKIVVSTSNYRPIMQRESYDRTTSTEFNWKKVVVLRFVNGVWYQLASY